MCVQLSPPPPFPLSPSPKKEGKGENKKGDVLSFFHFPLFFPSSSSSPLYLGKGKEERGAFPPSLPLLLPSSLPIALYNVPSLSLSFCPLSLSLSLGGSITHFLCLTTRERKTEKKKIEKGSQRKRGGNGGGGKNPLSLFTSPPPSLLNVCKQGSTERRITRRANAIALPHVLHY